jgi:hypothetical protein
VKRLIAQYREILVAYVGETDRNYRRAIAALDQAAALWDSGLTDTSWVLLGKTQAYIECYLETRVDRLK